MDTNYITKFGFEILAGGIISPLVLGILTGLLFNDFHTGAGVGAFLMIGSWVLLIFGSIIDKVFE